MIYFSYGSDTRGQSTVSATYIKSECFGILITHPMQSKVVLCCDYRHFMCVSDSSLECYEPTCMINWLGQFVRQVQPLMSTLNLPWMWSFRNELQARYDWFNLIFCFKFVCLYKCWRNHHLGQSLDFATTIVSAP